MYRSVDRSERNPSMASFRLSINAKLLRPCNPPYAKLDVCRRRPPPVDRMLRSSIRSSSTRHCTLAQVGSSCGDCQSPRLNRNVACAKMATEICVGIGSSDLPKQSSVAILVQARGIDRSMDRSVGGSIGRSIDHPFARSVNRRFDQ